MGTQKIATCSLPDRLKHFWAANPSEKCCPLAILPTRKKGQYLFLSWGFLFSFLHAVRMSLVPSSHLLTDTLLFPPFSFWLLDSRQDLINWPASQKEESLNYRYPLQRRKSYFFPCLSVCYCLHFFLVKPSYFLEGVGRPSTPGRVTWMEFQTRH